MPVHVGFLSKNVIRLSSREQAARVGDVNANYTRLAEFIRDNLLWCMARRASRATMKHFCWRKASRQRKMSESAGSFEVAVASLRSGAKRRFLARSKIAGNSARRGEPTSKISLYFRILIWPRRLSPSL